MNFITADTATRESIEDAIEAAFDAVSPNSYNPPDRHTLTNIIAGEMDEFLKERGVSRIEFFNSTHRMSALRAEFVTPLLGRGFTSGEISKATGMGKNVINGIQGKARK